MVVPESLAADEVRGAIHRLKYWRNLMMIGNMSLLVIFTIFSVIVINERIAQDRMASRFAEVVSQDPIKFLQYTGYMPSSTSEVKTGNTDDTSGIHEHVVVRSYNVGDLNETGVAAADFIAKYGGWVVDAENILMNHCDLDQMRMVLNKNTDTKFCRPR